MQFILIKVEHVAKWLRCRTREVWGSIPGAGRTWKPWASFGIHIAFVHTAVHGYLVEALNSSQEDDTVERASSNAREGYVLSPLNINMDIGL